jgi:hypothetical protein
MLGGSQVQGSRVDYVLGLDKTRLRAQIFQLDAIIVNCESRIDNLNNLIAQLNAELFRRTDRDAERLDLLLKKQEEIIDARLGLNQEKVLQPTDPRPIGKNRNWQADYEKKKRDEHWKKVIELQEAKDKTQ